MEAKCENLNITADKRNPPYFAVIRKCIEMEKKRDIP
jgi:hypothetical protein